jgi:hypothetical protein
MTIVNRAKDAVQFNVTRHSTTAKAVALTETAVCLRLVEEKDQAEWVKRTDVKDGES